MCQPRARDRRRHAGFNLTGTERVAGSTKKFDIDSSTSVDGKFLFWSVSDGDGGRTEQDLKVTETVGATDLTLVAWYFPLGGVGNGETAVLIDAYSVAKSAFVDDDFVTVTSDPSLTKPANVDGFVPTKVDELVQAFLSVASSPAEDFETWLLSPDSGTSESGRELTAPAGSGGLAFASYANTEREFGITRDLPILVGTILFGVGEDGGGIMIVGGKPIPIDPWGPLVGRLLTAIQVYVVAGNLGREAGARIQEVALRVIADVSLEINELAQKGVGLDLEPLVLEV